MSLAPPGLVGLQGFADPVAITLDEKRRNTFSSSFLFSCLFNFHSVFVEGGGSKWLFIVGIHSFWDRVVVAIVTFVQENKEERGGKGEEMDRTKQDFWEGIILRYRVVLPNPKRPQETKKLSGKHFLLGFQAFLTPSSSCE